LNISDDGSIMRLEATVPNVELVNEEVLQITIVESYDILSIDREGRKIGSQVLNVTLGVEGE